MHCKALFFLHTICFQKLINMFFLTLCLFLFFQNNLIIADYPPYDYCPEAKGNSTENSLFRTHVNSLLTSLSSYALRSKFHNMTAGNGTNTAYGLYLCINYVTLEDCKTCITMATQAITTLCPNSTDATVWEEKCQLRVADQRFFGHLDLTGDIPKYNKKVVAEPEKFRSVVNTSLFELSQHAAFNSSTYMYVTRAITFSNTDSIYSLVQCTPDLTPSDCYRCLTNAVSEILGSDKYQYRGGRLLSKSCYLRYEFYPFYEGATSEGPAGKGNNQVKKWIVPIVAVGLGCILLVIFGLLVFYFIRRNKTRDLAARDNPFFDLATVNAATDDFSDKNLLGEGGFGPVFKGTLHDGTKVAVKRLANTSDQGTEEFKNEVLLIMKLQHKNLVRLLGFCVEGAERLLVYELMSYGGLDSVLYDPQKRAQLTWSKRVDIINGIARGILYLHEDSRLRIIHRDLKPSNVLLDCDLSPKISDFGNARIYGGNESESSTAIVIGTYGYMAPEYAMEGIYSIKSDVYSFGIILLEVITGTKSLGFHLGGKGPSLQAYAWNMWSKGRGLELMDSLLTSFESCNVNDFLSFLQIGLLCVQEDASDRPTMSLVVQMLKSEIVNLHAPKHPAFSVGSFGDHYEASPRLSTSVQCLGLSDILGR